MGEKKPNETPESKGKHEKKPNFLDSLKIDEGIGKIREKLNELKILDTLDSIFLWSSTPGLQMALKLMFQFDVKGKDNFPKKGEAAVIVMNHQTPLDPLLLNLGVNQQVKWFIPKKNLNIPIVRSIVPLYGLIIMDDNMGEMEAAGQIIQMLKEGQSVGLFPEGKASEDGRLNKFHRFPVRFCLELKVPYVPVAIIGGVDAFPPKSKPWEAKIGKKIEIRIGKPVKLDPSIKSNPENALKIAEQMQREVQALLDQ